jgi:hypothetical protein
MASIAEGARGAYIDVAGFIECARCSPITGDSEPLACRRAGWTLALDAGPPSPESQGLTTEQLC